MPPKGIFRPAAAGPLRGRGRLGAVAKAKVRAEAKAKVPARAPRGARGILRRPAGRGEEVDLGEKGISEFFEEGGEVAVGDLPLHLWKTGIRVVFTEAVYWEEKVKAAGVVKGLRVEDGQAHLTMTLEGTREEALVKWAGAHPGTNLVVHLCPQDCGRMSKDGLLHGIKVKKMRDGDREQWMDNLVEVRAGGGEGENDELRKIREGAERRKAERTGEQRAPGGPSPVQSSGSSDSADGVKKKKKAKKKKKKKEDSKGKMKITGTKELNAVFGTTALDPSPGVRKFERKQRRPHGGDQGGEIHRQRLPWKAAPTARDLSTKPVTCLETK